MISEVSYLQYGKSERDRLMILTDGRLQRRLDEMNLMSVRVRGTGRELLVAEIITCLEELQERRYADGVSYEPGDVHLFAGIG